MKEIKLNNLKIECFKGIKSFEVELCGENIVIKAENGVGKTTVFDSFLWLLFSKDSTGRKDFKVRPLDKNNKPLKGLVVSVEIEIETDGIVHTFLKEQHEHVVKKQLRGYETRCFIDEVPKKVGEYADYIADLIPEDTFKLLTDLSHFNVKLPWPDRRKVLLDIADQIGTPKGFDSLLDTLNGRTVDEYKKVLSEQKKRYVKERDEINPRIDEIQRGLNEFNFKVDTKSIEAEREKIKTKIVELDRQRQGFFDKEKERQLKIELVNELERRKVQRESELANDTSGIKSLLDEKAELEILTTDKKQTVFRIRNEWTTQQTKLSVVKNQLDAVMVSLESIRVEYKTASEAPVDDTCYVCGQKLPTDRLSELEDKRKNSLADITERGNKIKADVDIYKAAIAEDEVKLKELGETLGKLEAELLEAQQAKDKRFVEIDDAVKNKATIKPSDDDICKSIYDEIIEVRKQIGEPVSEQMQKLDNQRTERQNAIASLNKALAQADRMKLDKTRIADLEEKEKDLAQKIADVEKQLDEISSYEATESGLIEDAVNGKFKHVKFKLFEQLLNGGVEPCCKATYKGVPYSDISYGQRILVGLDIINTLSAHYGVSVPIFIDNTEGLTYPVETDAQTIKLFAEKGITKLIIEKEGVIANV